MAENPHLPDTLARILERYEGITEDRVMLRAAAIDAYFAGKIDGIDQLSKAFEKSRAERAA